MPEQSRTPEEAGSGDAESRQRGRPKTSPEQKEAKRKARYERARLRRKQEREERLKRNPVKKPEAAAKSKESPSKRTAPKATAKSEKPESKTPAKKPDPEKEPAVAKSKGTSPKAILKSQEADAAKSQGFADAIRAALDGDPDVNSEEIKRALDMIGKREAAKQAERNAPMVSRKTAHLSSKETPKETSKESVKSPMEKVIAKAKDKTQKVTAKVVGGSVVIESQEISPKKSEKPSAKSVAAPKPEVKKSTPPAKEAASAKKPVKPVAKAEVPVKKSAAPVKSVAPAKKVTAKQPASPVKSVAPAQKVVAKAEPAKPAEPVKKPVATAKSVAPVKEPDAAAKAEVPAKKKRPSRPNTMWEEGQKSLRKAVGVVVEENLSGKAADEIRHGAGSGASGMDSRRVTTLLKQARDESRKRVRIGKIHMESIQRCTLCPAHELALGQFRDDSQDEVTKPAGVCVHRSLATEWPEGRAVSEEESQDFPSWCPLVDLSVDFDALTASVKTGKKARSPSRTSKNQGTNGTNSPSQKQPKGGTKKGELTAAQDLEPVILGKSLLV